MKYKLIAIDMDGTLLNSQNRISHKNREALVSAWQNGILTVLATGRILRSALYFWELLGLDNPLIASNGALISSENGRKILYENAMSTDTINDVIELLEKDGIYYHFYDRDTFYSKGHDYGLARYYKNFERNFKEQGIKLVTFSNPMDIIKNNDKKIYKIVVVEDNVKILGRLRLKLEDISGISVSSSWFNNIEIMNKGVSKGTGLEYLIQLLNIDKSQVAAIGDNENDISMFDMAGLAIGMENGIANIKEHVHLVTDTNDQNGVANAIEKYILSR